MRVELWLSTEILSGTAPAARQQVCCSNTLLFVDSLLLSSSPGVWQGLEHDVARQACAFDQAVQYMGWCAGTRRGGKGSCPHGWKRRPSSQCRPSSSPSAAAAPRHGLSAQTAASSSTAAVSAAAAVSRADGACTPAATAAHAAAAPNACGPPAAAAPGTTASGSHPGAQPAAWGCPPACQHAACTPSTADGCGRAQWAALDSRTAPVPATTHTGTCAAAPCASLSHTPAHGQWLAACVSCTPRLAAAAAAAPAAATPHAAAAACARCGRAYGTALSCIPCISCSCAGKPAPHQHAQPAPQSRHQPSAHVSTRQCQPAQRVPGSTGRAHRSISEQLAAGLDPGRLPQRPGAEGYKLRPRIPQGSV